ncbi:MAG: hypothetical protein WAqPseu_26580 [Shewanella algae]
MNYATKPCTARENNRSIKLEKFKDQTLSDKQIERHVSLTRVEELKPEDFE